jgi:hypothetical protein
MNSSPCAESLINFSVSQPPATDLCGCRLQLDGRDWIGEVNVSCWHKGEACGAAANLSGMCGSSAVPTMRSGWLSLTPFRRKVDTPIAVQHWRGPGLSNLVSWSRHPSA